MSNVYDRIANATWDKATRKVGALTFEGTMHDWMEFQADRRVFDVVDMRHPPRPDEPFKFNGISVTFKTPKPHEPVVVRRRRDGQWLRRNDGKGRLVLFMEGLPPLKVARSEAENIIRVDMGRDLAEFEILTMTEYEGLTTPETLRT